MESSEEEGCTPPEIREQAQEMDLDLLPAQSRKLYEDEYKKFVDWKKANKAITSENCLNVYFKEIMKKYKGTTLWSTYSKLKSTIQVPEKISIGNYKELSAILSNFSKGQEKKKAKILITAELNSFLEKAPDDTYLAAKVSNETIH